jgi:hypothetical protein
LNAVIPFLFLPVEDHFMRPIKKHNDVY